MTGPPLPDEPLFPNSPPMIRPSSRGSGEQIGVLIGSSLAVEQMPFTLPGLLKAVRAASKPAFKEMNLAAARAGFDLTPVDP